MVGEQLIKNCTQPIHVCCTGKLAILTSRLFWCHVAWCAEHLQRVRYGAFGLDESRKAKISEVWFACLIEQDVAWFDVAMKNPVFVCVIDSASDLRGEFGCLADRHRRAFNDLIKLAAVDELHAEVA